MRNPKNKGSQFERHLCGELSRWWTKGKRDDVFWRSSGSGARATRRSSRGQKTVNSSGDMMAMDPIGAPFLGVFSIEMKRGYSDCSISGLLEGMKGSLIIADWIEQARSSCIAASTYSWLIIHKRDHRPTIVYMEEFGYAGACPLRYFDHLTFQGGRGGDLDLIICMRLSDWMKWMTPERVTNIWEHSIRV